MSYQDPSFLFQIPVSQGGYWYDHVHTTPQAPYASATHEFSSPFDHQSSINSAYPAQTSASSLAVRPVRNTSSTTDHPYGQSRLRPRPVHDHIHYHAHHPSSQQPQFSDQIVPSEASYYVWQSRAIESSFPNSSPSYLVYMGQPTFENSMEVSYPHVDPADVKYAHQHYPHKRCFYRCRYGTNCGKWIIGERRRILRHLRAYHNMSSGPAKCLWYGCTKIHPMRQENLSRHLVMHLGVKWKCPGHCQALFSRDDAAKRHFERERRDEEMPIAEVIPGEGAHSWNQLQ